MTRLLESLTVFYGELTPNRAVVHAYAAGGQELAELSLAGLVRGPRCSRGNTLPATYRLAGKVFNRPHQDSGQVERLPHAEALITEPVFWSPDWPALYDVTVELRRGSEVIEQATRTIGLRPLAVVGKDLHFAGKRWVIRAVHLEHPLTADIANWGEPTAIFAPAEALDDRLLTMASELGVLVIAQLPRGNAEGELSRLSRYAAVAIAVLPPAGESVRSAAVANIVPARLLEQGAVDPQPDDARLLIGEVTDTATFADWATYLARPVLAFRPRPDPQEAHAPRRECDRLQRDLAPGGQFAGYIV